MSTLSISYAEARDVHTPGVVVINGDMRAASGRLPRVGSKISAGLFNYESAQHGPLDLLVHCERLSNTELGFKLELFNRKGLLVQRLDFQQPQRLPG